MHDRNPNTNPTPTSVQPHIPFPTRCDMRRRLTRAFLISSPPLCQSDPNNIDRARRSHTLPSPPIYAGAILIT